VWRVEGKDLVEVNRESRGHFYAGDSYVIMYTYRPRRKEEYIIYTWQGLDSSKDEVLFIEKICKNFNVAEVTDIYF